MARGLRISQCSLVVADQDEDYGTVVAAYENPMLRNLRVDLRRYPEIQRALRRREVVLVQDVRTDPLYEEVRAEWEAEGRAVPHPLGDRPAVHPAGPAGRGLLPAHHAG